MKTIDMYSFCGVEFDRPSTLNGQSKERYLAHHGIKGQKWGVKNGPPYPLDRTAHDYVVTGGSLSKEEKRQQRIDKVKSDLDKRKNGFTSLDSIPKAEIDYYDEVFNNHNEKVLLHGINRVEEMTKDVTENNLSQEEADKKYYNRTHNCYYCTQAGIMRLKGYKVRAQEASEGLPGNVTRSILWKNSLAAKGEFKDWHKAMEALASRGNGSYGDFCFSWKNKGGHSIIWTVNKNEIVFMDGQFERIRGVYNINSGEFTPKLEKYLDRIDLSKIHFYDMTNAEPTEYMLKMIE